MNSLDELKTAQNEYTGALIRLAKVKFLLENGKTAERVKGIEGKNQAERDAYLRTKLDSLFRNEHEANNEVIVKRGAFENASRQFEHFKITAQIPGV